MKRVLIFTILALLFAVPASAASITWSVTSLSADDPGFLDGVTLTTLNNIYILNLPHFSTISQFGFPPNYLDLAVTATATGGNIFGVKFTFFGLFSDGGTAVFSQTANSSFLSDSFSSPLYTGQFTFANTSSLNLLSTFNLDDMGGSAAVTGVRYELLTTPEPTSLGLLGIGIALLAICVKVRRRDGFVETS